jgi:hypothetical protein
LKLPQHVDDWIIVNYVQEAGHHAGPSNIELVISHDMLNGIDEDPECQIIFTAVPYPLEQADMDQPVHCPPPEPCIVHVHRTFSQLLKPVLAI